MNKYGAQMIYKLGIGDDEKDNIIEYFNEWKKDIWPVLIKEFGASGKMEIEPSEINLDLETLDDSSKVFPFEGIISSFHKEKSFKEQRKGGKYQFKVKNFLSFDTYRIGIKSHFKPFLNS